MFVLQRRSHVRIVLSGPRIKAQLQRQVKELKAIWSPRNKHGRIGMASNSNLIAMHSCATTIYSSTKIQGNLLEYVLACSQLALLLHAGHSAYVCTGYKL